MLPIVLMMVVGSQNCCAAFMQLEQTELRPRDDNLELALT